MSGKVPSGASFSKSSKFGQNFENFEKSRNFKNLVEGGAPALRVIRAGTRLTVHRSLPYQNIIDSDQSGAGHAGTFEHKIYVLDYDCLHECAREFRK